MAWTTSACLRARPSFADAVFARLKPARYLLASLRRAVLRTQPGVFLALSAVSLGALTPFLPTSFTAAVLLLTGITLAVLGAGANLAGTVSAARKPRVPPSFAVPHPAAPPHHSQIAYQAASSAHPRPLRSCRPQPALISKHEWAELMARINHELRTPLNAVIGFSEVMALEMFGPLGNERYQDYVRYIRDSAGELLKSAEDTLALTALLTNPRPPEPPRACVLGHAIADAWAFIERKAALRDVALELAMPEDIEVLGEPRALRQILVNVLSEAVARAVPGGRVSLLAVADGELIEVVVSVSGEQPNVVPRAGSLAICLARTLLEMQGTSLLEIETSAGGWRAVTVLDRAVQPDFFAGRTLPHAYPRPAALVV
ncbi:sensor histidine kinase KdpD [Hyphomicrobium sp.]|uniref:sensor histidine kinase n=3 Tax=Hyphomicrobium sp. TaxID=82 RepID=UPI001329D93C|nr:HAMP domain-containing sensor histidine kinase [Hyphomicrobium sp.]KAB2940153.1 MAG: HAMP domain-containing histidine kinase [Hyphomicrobium sp.]